MDFITSENGTSTHESAVLSSIRTLLFFTFIAGLFGTGGELLLMSHTEVFQLIPLILIGCCAVTSGLYGVIRDKVSLKIFRASLILLIAGGITGLYFHFKGNLEFEQEINPAVIGFALYWKAIQGISPPSLAPCSLSLLGMVGLLSTYGHPLLTVTQKNSKSGNRGELHNEL